MRTLALIFAATVTLLAAPARAEPIKPGETRSNIVYGSYSGLHLLLDVKAPAKPNGFAVLHIPGSGWQAPLGWEPWQLNDPAFQGPVEQPFLDAGFTVITITHRAAPRFPFPAPVEDAQRAARFIRAHAADFGVRADWLGLVGASSGAHLVSMLALLGEGTDAGIAPAAAGAAKAQCVVAVMAPIDLLALGQQGDGVALATQFIGTTAPFPDEKPFPGYSERLAPWLAASPLSYLNGQGKLPEFLLLHGDRDKLVPMAQSELFATKLKGAGASVDYRVMKDTGHQFPVPYRVQAAQWLTACLAKTRPDRSDG